MILNRCFIERDMRTRTRTVVVVSDLKPGPRGKRGGAAGKFDTISH